MLLKTCPFCGFQPIESDGDCIYPITRDLEVWGLHCYETAGGCGTQVIGDSKEDVITKWNTRADMKNKTIYCLQREHFLVREKGIIKCKTDDISLYVSFKNLEKESSPEMIPVGSVEFTKKFAEIHGIHIPYFSTYPSELKDFLGRKITTGLYKNVLRHEFVKPIITKEFDGALKKDVIGYIPLDRIVWISEKINPRFEWRFYILDREILGFSRYDGLDEECDPDQGFVLEMVKAFKNCPNGYTLDIAKLDNGKFVLIEANDAWSLGYYPWGTMSERDYIKLITERWEQIKYENSKKWLTRRKI